MNFRKAGTLAQTISVFLRAGNGHRRAHLRGGSFARALPAGGGHIAVPVPREEACSGRSGFVACGDPYREGQSFGGRHRIRVVSGVQ